MLPSLDSISVGKLREKKKHAFDYNRLCTAIHNPVFNTLKIFLIVLYPFTGCYFIAGNFF